MEFEVQFSRKRFFATHFVWPSIVLSNLTLKKKERKGMNVFIVVQKSR